LTLQAGVQWFEAYDAAEANSRIIIGGVTAGGSVSSWRCRWMVTWWRTQCILASAWTR
ncbi:hypothetical protein K435DRAFT_857803, partial [Dendrothele bispora CBS 962.96]